MNSLELTDEQIIDLIFEKKITCGQNVISTKHSCLAILAKLDERLRDGKIIRSEDPIFCRHVECTNTRNRKRACVA